MKICPNCHAEMDDNVKFCTSCGYDLRNVAPVQSTAPVEEQPASEAPQTSTAPTSEAVNNETTAQPQQAASQQQSTNQQNQQQAQHRSASVTIDTASMAAASQGYWKWLVGSWKSPFAFQKTGKFAGCITFLIEALLFTLGVGHFVQLAATAANTYANSAASIFGGESSATTSSYSIGAGFYIAMILTVLIGAIAMVGVAYLISRAVSSIAANLGFVDFMNAIAHYSSSILILLVIFDIVAFLAGSSVGSVVLILFVVTLIPAIWSISIITSIVFCQSRSSFDRIYGALIAMVINSFIYMIAGSIAGSQLASVAQDLISQLSGLF